MIWKKIFSYLAFWKKSDNPSGNRNLAVMHTINKISILMFLFAMIVLIIRYAF